MLSAGMKAPEFELLDTEQNVVRLSSLISGSPVLVAFFRITCPTCHYTFPFLQRLARSVRVLGISQDEPNATAEFRRAFGIDFPIVFDRAPAYSSSNSYGITNVPSLFLIEPDGTIAVASSGFSRQDLQSVAARCGGAEVFGAGEAVPDFRPG
jgi:peroxiredoxin